MRLIRGLNRWPGGTGCVATIGNFDGLHLGHQAIFGKLIEAGQSRSLPTTVISFEPLPHEYFSASSAPCRLNGFRDRVQSTAALGIDQLLLLSFNEELSSQPAADFVQHTLVNTLKVQHLMVGDDFRFGHNREGDFELLQTLADSGGYTLEQNQTVTAGGERISSTRVRKHLANGELASAAELLGRPYAISGRVIHGEKVGRQLGFPTANVALGKHRPPPRGVFAVIAHCKQTSKSYGAVANLGERPTVGGRRLLLEVHVLDTDVQLYGHHMQIDFIEFIRAEQKFDSLDSLKEAIANDAQSAREILKSHSQRKDLANRIG